MKIFVLFVLVTVSQTSWRQDLECGGNPIPECKLKINSVLQVDSNTFKLKQALKTM